LWNPLAGDRRDSDLASDRAFFDVPTLLTSVAHNSWYAIFLDSPPRDSMNLQSVTTLFLDIGGVLLTNSWDRHSRAKAAVQFSLDLDELNQRHQMCVDRFERGRMSLETYLERTVFYQPRDFSEQQFRDWMFDQSHFLPDMLQWIRELNQANRFHIAAISNESRELTEYRIDRFNLLTVFDLFVCSCFVNLRKPDSDIYRLALDLTQARPEQVLYVDDRQMFVDVASTLGIRSVCHLSFESTKQWFAESGVRV
jgi:putative hydrolase of the HAD superfamily